MDTKNPIYKNQKETLKRVLSFVEPHQKYIWYSFFFACITVILTLYTPILIGNAIDCMVEKGNVDFAVLKQLFFQFIIVILISSISQWCMSYFNNKMTYFIVSDIRIKTFERINHLPIRYIDGKPYGDVVSRIVNDVDQFSEGLLMGFTQLFTGVFTIVGTFLFMLSIHYKITIVVVCITPISLFVAGYIAKKTYRMFHLQSESRSDLTTHVEEMIGNQKIVKAFGYEDVSMQEFYQLNERLSKCSLRAIFFSSIVNPATRFVNGIVYMSVGVIGAFIAIQGGISIGQLSSFLSYANQYTKPFNEISGVITELQNALACASRVFEILDEIEEKKDDEDAVVLTRDEISQNTNFELSNVSFSYDQSRPLLQELDLTVKKGNRIAIVGPTGSGKSTLINLLMRFYDIDSGSIVLNGTDIYKIQKDSYRNQFGMVLQETWLKSGTIAENIAYGRKNAKREEIIKAAKASYAHNFIKKMQNGYDTMIDEDGGNLSEGQKQLLCIARVMLELPPVLILDEATSSIDTLTELRVQNAFQKLMIGRTSFIVAHRLSTIKEADLILVLKEGNIVEQGNHKELLEKGGFYSQLYKSQFS